MWCTWISGDFIGFNDGVNRFHGKIVGCSEMSLDFAEFYHQEKRNYGDDAA